METRSDGARTIKNVINLNIYLNISLLKIASIACVSNTFQSIDKPPIVTDIITSPFDIPAIKYPWNQNKQISDDD